MDNSNSDFFIGARKIKMSHNQDVMDYCNAVIRKKEIAGRYEIKAVERFLRDIENSKSGAFPFVLKPEKADLVINFAETLVIPDIEATEENPQRQLRLLPWQKFAFYNLFGWYSKFDEAKGAFKMLILRLPEKTQKLHHYYSRLFCMIF